MKRGIIWVTLTCLMVTSLVLASCTKSSTTSTSSTSITTSTTSTITTTKTTVTTTAPSSTITTTSAVGNWWDSLGKPQYGGQLSVRSKTDFTGYDPYFSSSLQSIEAAWLERLSADNWTVNPAEFDYQMQFRPNQYVRGQLAESWEFSDPGTYVIHIRKGIHWQDIAPVNGREFTADDVVYHYNRIYGMGSGFTVASPYQVKEAVIQSLISVTATDKYIVVFKFKLTNPEAIMETLQATGGNTHDIEAPEAVQKWGDVTDWTHAIGTGPFILKDYVRSASASLVRNPNYWGYDERYPQNKLPYAEKLTYLVVPDDTTAIAGVRTGKIDLLWGCTLDQAQSIKKTNPEILVIKERISGTYGVDLRVDVVPFKDLRVRIAMQMAIDLPSIASGYYGGTADPYPSPLTTSYLKGYSFPYEDWPQDLKDEYAYNPPAAKNLLAAAGYTSGFKTNVAADASSDLNLLQIVKSYFSNIGIDMQINTLDHATWGSFVQLGHKHDQIAYRGGVAGSLGLTYEPISHFNRFASGFAANYNMVADPAFDALGAKALAATSIDEMKQAVVDANKLFVRQHYVISLLQPTVFDFSQPWIKGYNGQMYAVYAGSGPRLNGFYMARFWVDQNLKKSMGK